jgi:hypothetical protein
MPDLRPLTERRSGHKSVLPLWPAVTTGMDATWLKKTHSPAQLNELDRIALAQIADTAPNLGQPAFARLATADLATVFAAVDQAYHAGMLGKACRAPGIRLDFRLSSRMTHTGGTTAFWVARPSGQRRYVITVAPRVIHDSFGAVNEAVVCGLVCRSMREALLRIMQHESMHLAEFLIWGNSNCSATRFRQLVSGNYGHTESKHRLLSPAQRARIVHAIGPGDQVSFPFQGNELSGRVNRVSRRATVLVPDPQGQRFSDGGRYRRFYVPLTILRRLG